MTTKPEARDPSDLRIHRLHKQHLPAQDTSTDNAVWISFVDAISAAGPEGIPPLVITEAGEIMDGANRWLAAKQLAWPEIRCDIRPEHEAATIMVDSLFGQRSMTRGAKVYIALGLQKEFIESAEKRRLANLKQGRKTLEKPLKLPKESNLPSGASDLCARWGVSVETYKRANQVREIFAQHADIKAEWEPKLLSGEKNLWNVLSAVGGAGTDQSGRGAGVERAQLEFWESPFSGLQHALPAWKKLDDDRRSAVLDEWRKTAKKLPADLRAGMKEVLEELE
jgi:ParB-like chromosome segregation protein Spo0J